MASAVVTATARTDLDRLIRTHRLPPSTRGRVKAAIEPLRTYPRLGRALLGGWAGFRVVIGPWPWMLLVYQYDQASDRVAIITIQDSRSAHAAVSPE